MQSSHETTRRCALPKQGNALRKSKQGVQEAGNGWERSQLRSQGGSCEQGQADDQSRWGR